MPLEKVTSGEPLEIPASTYNAFIDSTRDFQKKGGFKNKPTKHNTPYYIQNKTGKRLPIYSVVMITDLALDAPDSANTDVNLNWLIGTEIVFKGEIPDKTSPHFNKICITQEPIEIDGVGKGLLDGISKCQIKRKETGIFSNLIKTFLSPEDQNTDTLILSNFGLFEMVYGQAFNTETVYNAIVNLTAVIVPTYQLVDLVWKSGGDSTTAYEARIYDIALNGKILKTDVDIAAGNNPYRRPQDYNVTKANIAMAFSNGSDDVLIAWANEYPLLGSAEVIP